MHESSSLNPQHCQHFLGSPPQRRRGLVPVIGEKKPKLCCLLKLFSYFSILFSFPALIFLYWSVFLLLGQSIWHTIGKGEELYFFHIFTEFSAWSFGLQGSDFMAGKAGWPIAVRKQKERKRPAKIQPPKVPLDHCGSPHDPWICPYWHVQLIHWQTELTTGIHSPESPACEPTRFLLL